jgi:GDP-4-dehydro-6-deoxy-D-mannose reductase
VKKILITGVGGFCARHLLRRLKARGDCIYGTDLGEQPPADRDIDGYVHLDLTDSSKVSELLNYLQPDAVFHLAGLFSGDPFQIYRVNFLGGLNLLEAIRKLAPDAKVLGIGSAAEYGEVPEENLPVQETSPCNPTNAYGISKYAMTLAAMDYARNYGVRVVIARPFNIIGPGMPASLVVGAILEKIKKAFMTQQDPVVIRVGNLFTERDFIAVDDVVEAYISLMEGDRWGEVFNICAGAPRSVQSVLESLISGAARPIQFRVDPSLVRLSDVRCVYGSFDKAHRAFGFSPKVPLEAALRTTWDHAMKDLD